MLRLERCLTDHADIRFGDPDALLFNDVSSLAEQPINASRHPMWQRIRAFFVARQWRTIEERDHEAIVFVGDGTTSRVPCKFRWQVCDITGRIRTQSKLGAGWITEEEVVP